MPDKTIFIRRIPINNVTETDITVSRSCNFIRLIKEDITDAWLRTTPGDTTTQRRLFAGQTLPLTDISPKGPGNYRFHTNQILYRALDLIGSSEIVIEEIVE